MKKTLVITGELARKAICREAMSAPDGYVVTISEPKRNLSQNAAMWPILEAFSKQLEWPINGVMTKLEPEEWKDILTAAFRNEMPRVAMGIGGGMVMLGQRTREFKRAEFSNWLEFLHMVAADRGVEIERRAA